MDHLRFHIDSMYVRVKVPSGRSLSRGGYYFVWITAVASRSWTRLNIIKDVLAFDGVLNPIENCDSETIRDNG